MREPAAFFVRQAIIARRPGVDLNLFNVGDTAPDQRRPKTWIGPGHFSHEKDVVDQDTRPHAGHMPPIDDPIRDKIDSGFPDLAVGPVESAHKGLTRKDRPRLYVKHRALVGFVQADGLKHHTRPEIMRCTYGGCGAADFIRCQWIQRMPR